MVTLIRASFDGQEQSIPADLSIPASRVQRHGQGIMLKAIVQDKFLVVATTSPLWACDAFHYRSASFGPDQDAYASTTMSEVVPSQLTWPFFKEATQRSNDVLELLAIRPLYEVQIWSSRFPTQWRKYLATTAFPKQYLWPW
jgi:hypothetical protein